MAEDGSHNRTRTAGRALSAFLALSLMTAACGARVTKSQIAAYKAYWDGQAVAGSSGSIDGGGSESTGSAGAPSAGSGRTIGGSGGETATSLAGSSGSSGTGGAPSGSGGGSAAGGAGSGSSQAAGGGSGGATTAGGSTPSAGSGVAVNPAICSSLPNGPGVSATEIDIGNVSTLTGPVPGLFLGAQQGVTAFAALINSLGGICGRKLVLKSADDDLDVSQNATATQSLAGSVLAFVGSFSADDQGGASVLASDGVPDIGEALSTQRFDLKNNFSPEPRPPGWNVAPWVLLKKEYPQAALHMAVLTENQATAQAEEQAQVDGLESIGYKFVYTDNNVQPTQTDFSSDAEAMKAAGAQGVVFQATAPFYADLAKADQTAGLTLTLGNYGSGAYDPEFIPDAGSAANGAVIVQTEAMYQGQDAGSVPMVAQFDKWFKALYNTTPDLFAAWGWTSAVLFLDGLDAGGGVSRADLLKGLDTVTSFNAGGMVAPDDPAQKKPPLCYLIIDVKNGGFVRDPSDPATGFNCTDTPNYYYFNG